MKRSSAVASVCLALAMLSSCDTNKDVDGGISSLTYTTNNSVSPSDVVVTTSGIVLSNLTTSNVTWSCPSGYVVPTKLLNSPPTDGNSTTIKYTGTETTGRALFIRFDSENRIWYVSGQVAGAIYDDTDYDVNNDNDAAIDFICTEIGTQDNWS